jgi:hypothetical protein
MAYDLKEFTDVDYTGVDLEELVQDNQTYLNYLRAARVRPTSTYAPNLEGRRGMLWFAQKLSRGNEIPVIAALTFTNTVGITPMTEWYVGAPSFEKFKATLETVQDSARPFHAALMASAEHGVFHDPHEALSFLRIILPPPDYGIAEIQRGIDLTHRPESTQAA